jgi:diguanylate cyclase (GGDEF)-like protein
MQALELARERAVRITRPWPLSAALTAAVALVNATATASSTLPAWVQLAFGVAFCVAAGTRLWLIATLKPETAELTKLQTFARRLPWFSGAVGVIWALWVGFGQHMPATGQMAMASMIAGTCFVALRTMAAYPVSYLWFCLPPIAALATIPVVDAQGSTSYAPVLSGSLLVFCLMMLKSYHHLVSTDIEATVRLNAYKHQRQRLQQSHNAALLWVRLDGSMDASPAALKLLELGSQPLLSALFAGLMVKPQHGQRLLAAAMRQVQQDGMLAWSARFKTASGARLWLDLQLGPADPANQAQGLVISINDSTNRRNAQAKAVWLGRHDALTGLFNRLVLETRLAQLLAKHGHTDQAAPAFAVLSLDLDGFKQINDQHGHAVGDETLKVVAKRLVHGLRKGDLVARMGGDEFVVLLENTTEPTQASLIAQHLIDQIAQPIALTAIQVNIGVSIGIAMCPADALTVSGLLNKADASMYLVKHAAKPAMRTDLVGLV